MSSAGTGIPGLETAEDFSTANCPAHTKPLRMTGCRHCAEDEKILEEALWRVVEAVHPGSRQIMRYELRDALGSLVREIRR